jgi:hypothetical protein
MEQKTKSKFKWWYVIVGLIALSIISNLMDSPKTNKVTEDQTDALMETQDSKQDSKPEQTVVSPWAYQSETDKMSGKETYYAFATAKDLLEFEFPYNGGSEAKLQIRKKGTNTDIMLIVSKGQFIVGVDGGLAKIKFDDEPAFSIRLSSPSDYSSDVVFLGSERKLIEKLKKAKKALIEVEFYNEGIRIIEFDTFNFEWNH